jgi:hypothetical protein
MSFNLSTIATGYNVSILNNNFTSVANQFNTYALYSSGGQNVMSQDLDMNGYTLLNMATNPSEGSSMVTVSYVNSTFLPFSGGTLTGPLNMAGNAITNLPEATSPSSPALYSDITTEAAARTLADTALQAEISGGAPLTASAFSPISWHAQVINNSVTIPANVNAWSFGPTITIGTGQTITIGTGSYWTIANGQTVT